MYIIILFLLVGCVFCEIDRLQGWNYINLNCRDNDNKPVDWWILYKPPTSNSLHFETGYNFTYITPETAGNWQASDTYINSNSMLQHTFSPLYRPTYEDHLAVLAYRPKKKKGTNPGSSAFGVMVADEMQGIWIIHTVPGLLDFNHDRSQIPADQIENGQMIMCLSFDLIIMNMIARAVKEAEPDVFHVRVPTAHKIWLPEWEAMSQSRKEATVGKPPRKILEVLTNGKLLRASVIVRKPGESHCLYRTFAMTKNLMLDAYGHDNRRKPICEKNYSVRHVDTISLKYPETIVYINNKTDRLGFAVSNTKDWHHRGEQSDYWTCISPTENEEWSKKGGIVVCLDDFHVWRSFDMLKIKEPEC